MLVVFAEVDLAALFAFNLYYSVNLVLCCSLQTVHASFFALT